MRIRRPSSIARALAVPLAALCLAAGYAFSFGDKAESLSDLFRTYGASAMALSQGEKEKALEAFTELNRSFDQRFAAVAPGKPRPSGGDPSTEQAQTILAMHARVMRLCASLLEANLQMQAGAIPRNQWVSSYEQMLFDGEGAGDAVLTMLFVASDRLERQSIVELLEGRLPVAARHVLADWLIEQTLASQPMPRDAAMEFHNRVLAASSDTLAGPAVLRQYVGLLKEQAGPEAADRLLDWVMATSAHTELGATAARLRLDTLRSQAERESLAQRLTSEHPDTPLARAVQAEYMAALLARSDYEQALQSFDEQAELARSASDSEKASVYLKLAGKAAAMFGSDQEGSTSYSPYQDVTAPWLGLKLAEQLLARGDEQMAVEVLRLAIDEESMRQSVPSMAMAADEPVILAALIEHFQGDPPGDRPVVVTEEELSLWAQRLVGFYGDSPQTRRIVTRFPQYRPN